MEFICGEKGKTLILFEGFKFRFHLKLKGEINRWACCKKNCKSFLKLNEKNEILEKNLNHNHEKDSAKIQNRQILSNKLKRKAVEDISIRPSKILNRELQKNDVDTLTVQDMTRIRKNISHARRQEFPPLPRQLIDVHDALDSVNITTNRNEQFLLVNDKKENFVLFSTILNLIFLCNLTTIFVDGTFYTCPKFFKQIFTVHGFSQNLYIPLAFSMLLDKSINSYSNFFSYLVSECAKLNLTFAPPVIFVDFETSIHSAIKQIFPNSKIRGCRFDLGQCWWRKIQEFELTIEYKTANSEIGNFLKKFFGLAFLDPLEVNDCFIEDFMAIKPTNDKRVDDFCDYILENYVAEDCKFPPHIWAEFSSSLTRTTNCCESFHSKFKKNFNASQPKVFSPCKCFKRGSNRSLCQNEKQRRNEERDVGKRTFFARKNVTFAGTKNFKVRIRFSSLL